MSNKLTLNITKTEFMLITTRQKLSFIESNISINIEGRPTSQVNSAKTLGLYVQKNLSWSKNIDQIYKKASALGLLRPVRDLVDTEALITNIYKALVLPHLDYACVVWDGLDKGLSTKLQKIQNRAARILRIIL